MKREDIRDNLAWPLGVNLLASLIVVAVLSPLYRVAWWLPLAAAGALLLVLFPLTRRPLRRRHLMLRVAREVSSSQCGELFLRLAEACLRDFRVDDAMERLAAVAAVRRYPNQRFVEDLERAMAGAPDPAAAAHRYLRLAPVARQLARAQVSDALARFLGELPDTAHLVLYGYSSTICDGLAKVPDLRSPVFLIEDLQYGVEGSLGEHAIAEARLRQDGIKPILLSFDQIAQLRAPDSDFVRSAAGHSVPLPQQRTIVALLGCEAASTRGEILIPSKVRGVPSETAKFIEVIHQSASPGYRDASVVVVGESYKVYDRIDRNAVATHAPAKRARWADLAFMLGLRRLRAGLPVELVRLEESDFDIVIDDVEVSYARDGIDLKESRRAWDRQTVERAKGGSQPEMAAALRAIRCAIFDLNGVLMDDEQQHFIAFGDAMRAYGQSLRHDEYLECCSGRTDREGAVKLAAAKRLDCDIDEFVRQKRAAYDRVRSDYPQLTYPGAIDFARQLHGRGVECYLVTSCDRETATAFLAGCGLEDVFERRCSFEVASDLRADTYGAIVARSGVKGRACALFDDSPANLNLGRQAGFTTIGVATTHQADRLVADFVIPGSLTPLDEEAADGR